MSLFPGERPRALDVERMRRANQARLVRGRWTQAEVDWIRERARADAERFEDLIE